VGAWYAEQDQIRVLLVIQRVWRAPRGTRRPMVRLLELWRRANAICVRRAMAGRRLQVATADARYARRGTTKRRPAIQCARSVRRGIRRRAALRPVQAFAETVQLDMEVPVLVD
jgi:hypothetical protein